MAFLAIVPFAIEVLTDRHLKRISVFRGPACQRLEKLLASARIKVIVGLVQLLDAVLLIGAELGLPLFERHFIHQDLGKVIDLGMESALVVLNRLALFRLLVQLDFPLFEQQVEPVKVLRLSDLTVLLQLLRDLPTYHIDLWVEAAVLQLGGGLIRFGALSSFLLHPSHLG